VRFFAGVGLAGELGAGITLVSELVHKEKRGISTSLVAGIGLTGAVAAYFVAQYFHWRTCYFIGGGLGFCLLLLRISVFESGMYTAIRNKPVSRGDFFLFFTNAARFRKYLLAILIGLPTWYVIGILVAFSDVFARAFGFSGEVLPKKSTLFAYIAISVADVLVGLLSQWLRSRKKAVAVFYVITGVSIALFFSPLNSGPDAMYLIAAAMGFGTGFWALFVTMAAEQFGTNLRATATTTVPNMVRGSLPLLLILFEGLERLTGSYVTGAWITGLVVMLLSSVALKLTRETYGRDLDFEEG
jgi:hypothetical protein